ncbi:MAG: tetratricopeptide repeat protein [Candidatus Competibacteraceae bacterium]|nr:tetratricopeptide repeat protein [Candidatus Competibacteraceae bacterium]HRY15297.1 tetratricopeptide repeat protein [Candidatus Competibacteraceae bacterium]
MEQYTDDERVEDLKKWWNENGLSIIVGIALGVAAIFGWRYWNNYRDTQAEQASLTYDAFIKAVEKLDIEQTRQRGQSLLADFPNSSYAALTALRLAKLAVDSGDNATAIQRLQWVIANAKLAELQDIARLRLARVFFAAGQLTEAEKLLDSITIRSLTAEVKELRGDLYLAGNDLAKARTAYTAALAAGGANRLLQIKLDNLTAPTADTVIPASPPPPSPPVADAPPAPVPETAPVTPAPLVEPAPEPVAAEPAPVEPTLEPAAAEPAPVGPTPGPLAAEPTSVEPAPEPAAAEPTPVEPAPEPVITEPAPTSSPASTSGPPS